MGIRLNSPAGGYVELDAPTAAAGNNTLRMPTSNGSAGQTLNTDGAGNLSFGSSIVSGTAQNSTSGTNIDFTGIPSWAKRVTVMFNGVSTSGTANIRIQIGAGSITSSGYVGAATNTQNANATNGVAYLGGGFDLTNNTATVVQHGSLKIHNFTGNTWVADGVFSRTGAANGADFTAGYVTLSGTLDRVRITTTGTDTFDAGSINILYE